VTDAEWFWWFYYNVWEPINLSGWQQIVRYGYAFFYRYP
jgi:hypothetical protein